MTRKAKQLIGSIVFLFVLAAAICGMVYYVLSHPAIYILRASSDSEQYGHVDHIMIAGGPQPWNPLAHQFNVKTNQIVDWLNPIMEDIVQAELNGDKVYLYAFGKVRDGTTKLWYDGYILPKDGEPFRYYREQTFDFVLVSNHDLFNDSSALLFG